jgi:hypothetical protein
VRKPLADDWTRVIALARNAPPGTTRASRAGGSPARRAWTLRTKGGATRILNLHIQRQGSTPRSPTRSSYTGCIASSASLYGDTVTVTAKTQAADDVVLLPGLRPAPPVREQRRRHAQR